jgi:hypothetical protein
VSLNGASPTVWLVLVALASIVANRVSFRLFQVNFGSSSRRAAMRQSVLTLCLSAVADVAFALALHWPLDQLKVKSAVWLCVAGVLLGLVRCFGLGLAGLFVFSVWQTDCGLLMWFVLPLLVTSVISLTCFAIVKGFVDRLDIQGGSTPVVRQNQIGTGEVVLQLIDRPRAEDHRCDARTCCRRQADPGPDPVILESLGN